MITNKVYIGGQKYKWVDPFKKTAEWKAIENYANTNSYALPTNIDAYNQLIVNLKSAGIWQKLDVFYVFVGDGSNGFKLINWKNPNQHYADAYGGLTWSSDGVKGNGSNGYVDTNYNPSTDGVNRVVGDASIFGVAHQVGGRLWGATDQWNADSFDTNRSDKRLDSSFNNLPGVNQTGLHVLVRTSTTEGLYIHKNSSFALSQSTPQGGLLNGNNAIFRSTNTYGSGRLSCWATGGSLTYTETQSFRTIYNNFLTSLGLTPIA